MILNRKKGLTLIELIISLTISSFVLIIAISIISKDLTYKYLYEIEFSRELSLKNARIFLEGQVLRGDIVKIQCDEIENRLTFIFKNNLQTAEFTKKEIFIYRNRLTVKTYEMNNSTNINYFEEDIKEFTIKQKENLIYVTIVNKNDYREEICIVNRAMLY